MPNTNQLFRILSETIFILVGGLLALFGLTGRYLFNPRQAGWVALSVVLILWGGREWFRGRRAIRVEKLAHRIGGASDVAVGALMLSLAWAPFFWAGMLLAIAGGILVLRGLVVAGLMFSSR